MKRIEVSLNGVSAMTRMQWILSMLAIVACLFSVGSVHSHDNGLHALDSACISCDLEDLSSHGAAVTGSSTSTENLALIEPAVSMATVHILAAHKSAPIRAPPIFS